MKAKTILVSLISFFAFHLIGCGVQNTQTSASTIEATRASWIGVDESEIYKHEYWGIPDRQWTDGKGGKILEYRRTKSSYTSSFGYVSVTWITTFFINQDHKVYDLNARRE